MLDWILPSAWAHLPPVTGAIHLVEIPIADRACPVQLLTTLTRWDMDSASWDIVRAQRGRTLELMITSAYLTENRVTEGPYRPSAPRKLEVAP